LNISNDDPGNEVRGIVDIYPLATDRRKKEGGVWSKPYEGLMHDGGSPIIHIGPSSGYLPSHLQAIKIFNRDVNCTVGFTLKDVRGFPVTTEGYRSAAVIVGMSRSTNLNKAYTVTDDFVSVGSNSEDYKLAAEMYFSQVSGVEKFPELPTEVKRGLLDMFLEVSNTLDQGASFNQLFEAELLRPELQVRRRASVAA
jgi:hypothetical protein